MKNWAAIVVFAIIAFGLEIARHVYTGNADAAELIGGVEIFAWILAGALLVGQMSRKKAA